MALSAPGPSATSLRAPSLKQPHSLARRTTLQSWPSACTQAFNLLTDCLNLFLGVLWPIRKFRVSRIPRNARPNWLKLNFGHSRRLRQVADGSTILERVAHPAPPSPS